MRASAVMLWVLLAASSFGQEPKKEDVEATLVAFKGTVDVKRPEDKDWVAAERNMKLKKGSEICTAVASTASLLFAGGNVKVDVKPLTQAKIEELAKAGQKLNADVKLKFGAVEVDLRKGDLRTDMKVTAPNSTTSVSGSHGIVRAPATGGGGSITLTTFTGSWTHEAGGVGRSIEGPGAANNLHDLPRDLRYFDNTHEFMDFGGRHRDELYQGRGPGKAGDFNSDDVQFGDRSDRWPTSPKHKRPGILPPPPSPP